MIANPEAGANFPTEMHACISDYITLFLTSKVTNKKVCSNSILHIKVNSACLRVFTKYNNMTDHLKIFLA